MGNWNAILDLTIDKVGRDARGSGRCEGNLICFIARYDLLDRFRLDTPGREMWTWLDNSSSVKAKCHLDRVLEELTLVLLRVPCSIILRGLTIGLFGSVWLANRLTLAGYWKFNTSFLELRNFRDRLESPVLQASVGMVTGNKWWGSLRHRIRDFAIKYGRQLKVAKSLEDKLSRVVEERIS